MQMAEAECLFLFKVDLAGLNVFNIVHLLRLLYGSAIPHTCEDNIFIYIFLMHQEISESSNRAKRRQESRIREGEWVTDVCYS